jgi:GNAT superfamily N-acetyltransferase
MKKQQFRVDRASTADIERMADLLGELFAIERDFAADGKRQTAGLRRLIERDRDAAAFVARDATGSIIGMVTVQLVVSTAEGAPSARIEDVVVDGDVRRRGIGRALVEAALDWARGTGATRAQLLMDTSNAAAEAFYARLGWEKTQLAARRISLRK